MTQRHDTMNNDVRGRSREVSRRTLLQGVSATLAVAAAGAAVAPVAGVAAGPEDGRLPDAAYRPGASWLTIERGVRLRVQDWGAGKPILFVHGWPSSYRIFERQLHALAARGYRTIGIDQRGFGESDHPWDGNDYDTWARDLGAVIAALKLRDVTLVGYSMGGAIAGHYVATARTHHVSQLVLLAAAAPKLTWAEDNPGGAPPEMFDGMIDALLADRNQFFHDFIPGMFHQPISDAYRAWFTNLVVRSSLRATVRGLEEARDRDVRQSFAAIDVPTTIIHGVHDQVVPYALGEYQQRLIPNATLIPFENSGHGLFMDEADRLADAIAAVAG